MLINHMHSLSGKQVSPLAGIRIQHFPYMNMGFLGKFLFLGDYCVNCLDQVVGVGVQVSLSHVFTARMVMDEAGVWKHF